MIIHFNVFSTLVISKIGRYMNLNHIYHNEASFKVIHRGATQAGLAEY